ncbi:MAG: TrkA C-terminal domain-containing protein, partial [Flavobacteriales bacterium]
VDVIVKNRDIHGLALCNLRLPKDIIILSISRDKQMIISHGYTRLRVGDMVTMVGSVESLEAARLLFE